MAKYGPTPPFRMRGSVGETQLSPSMNDGPMGPEMLSSDVGEWVTFTDAVAHNIAATDIDQDICQSATVTIEAQDTLGNSAAVKADVSITRTGAGAPVIGGTPIFLGFTPNVGPWNTIVGNLVVVGNQIAVQVTGLPNTAIRWRGIVRIYGAQAKG